MTLDVNAWLVAQLLGHSSAYVTERYAHLSPSQDDSIGTMLSNQLATGAEEVRDRACEVLPGLAGLPSVGDPVLRPIPAVRESA